MHHLHKSVSISSSSLNHNSLVELALFINALVCVLYFFFLTFFFSLLIMRHDIVSSFAYFHLIVHPFHDFYGFLTLLYNLLKVNYFQRPYNYLHLRQFDCIVFNDVALVLRTLEVVRSNHRMNVYYYTVHKRIRRYIRTC